VNARCVCDLRHFSAKGVNLSHKVPLGCSANSRIAGHPSNGLAIHRYNKNGRTHSRGRHGCFKASVAGTANDDVVFHFADSHG
jgi:hypothetical protein